MTLRTFRFDTGETFEEPADWVRFACDAVHDRASYPYLGLDLRDGYGGPDKRLFDLYDGLRGTGAEFALADALLRLMETGTPSERYMARLGPYERAPRVVERISRLVTEDRKSMLQAGLVEHLIWQLYELGAHEVARRLLHDELYGVDGVDVGLLAWRRDFEWFVANLPPYKPNFDVSTWVFFQDGTQLHRLLDALSHDSGYVERLKRDLHDDTLDRQNEERVREQLLAHPIAKNWVE